MPRRYYPFNKRDLDWGSKLLANIVTSPQSLLSTNTKNSSKYNNTYKMEFTPLSPIKLIVFHIIFGMFYFLSPLVFLLFIKTDLWAFGAITITTFYQLFFIAPIMGITDDLAKNYIFNKFDLKKQISACKFVLKMWFWIFLIHTIFYIAYNIIQWISIVIFQIEQKFTLFHNDLDYFLFSISDISIITILIILLILFFNIYMTSKVKNMQKNLLKILSNNNSICKIIKWSKKVDNEILLNLFERKESDKIIFSNGCSLKKIIQSNIMNGGFILTDKLGNTTTFTFVNYIETPSDFFKKGYTIIGNMSKDINNLLQEHDINYAYHNPENNNLEEIISH